MNKILVAILSLSLSFGAFSSNQELDLNQNETASDPGGTIGTQPTKLSDPGGTIGATPLKDPGGTIGS